MENNELKIKAWGVRQAVIGAPRTDYFWFANKADRDHYMSEHNYCDALRCKQMPADIVYNSYADYQKSLEW